MNSEHEFEVPKRELEIPGSIYLEPDMLMALQKMERGKPLTWGATPLEPYRPDVHVQQGRVEGKINEYFPKSAQEVPYGLNWETALYIHGMFAMRNAHRVMRNQESYASRGNSHISHLAPEVLEMIERGVTGHASPAELGAIAEIEQIPTIELGSISMPWGTRMQHLPAMRRAVKDSVLLRKGKMLPQNRTYEVRHAVFLNKEFNKAEPSLLMTRTREIAEINDHIKDFERSSFVIILSRIALALNEQVKAIPYGENWSDTILKLPGFEESVDKALKENRYDVAVPMSTTVFEVNEEYVEKFLNNQEHITARYKQMFTNDL